MLTRLALKEVYEFVPDDSSLLLGISDAFESFQKYLLSVDVVEIQVHVIPKDPDHTLHLTLSQQAVVHENADRPLAHGLVKQNRNHRRIYAAAQGAYDPIVAKIAPDLLHRLSHKGLHGPGRFTVAYLKNKIAQDIYAMRGVHHLWMKLKAIQSPMGIPKGSHRTVLAIGNAFEPLRKLFNMISMAHPHRDLAVTLSSGDPLEKTRGFVYRNPSVPIFPS